MTCLWSSMPRMTRMMIMITPHKSSTSRNPLLSSLYAFSLFHFIRIFLLVALTDCHLLSCFVVRMMKREREYHLSYHYPRVFQTFISFLFCPLFPLFHSFLLSSCLPHHRLIFSTSSVSRLSLSLSRCPFMSSHSFHSSFYLPCAILLFIWIVCEKRKALNEEAMLLVSLVIIKEREGEIRSSSLISLASFPSSSFSLLSLLSLPFF